MRILFSALPAYGHVYPLMPLALACLEAGHEVVMATGPPFLDKLPISTWPSLPSELDLGWAEQETRRRHPDLRGYDAPVAMFGDIVAGVVAERLILGLPELAPDLMVYESMNVGAGVAAGVLGIPAVTFSISIATFVPGVIHRAAVRYNGHRWLEHGRQPPDTPLLAQVLVDPTPTSLQQPGEDAPPRLAIRSVAYSERTGTVPSWLRVPSARPRVYLTLGTVSFGAVEVLRRAVDEIASLDVDLLVAVGPQGDPALLGPVPNHVQVERFVAQPAVLDLVDLVAHHGGTGTVLGGLAAGLPQLILPQGADQFFNAEAITAVGAGRTLRNEEQQPGAIAKAVGEMLGSSSQRAVAQRVGREIAGQPAPRDVVPELEKLVSA